jgi:hypothetical protein
MQGRPNRNSAELRQQLASVQASQARREQTRAALHADQTLAERIRQAEAVQAFTAEIMRELEDRNFSGILQAPGHPVHASGASGVGQVSALQHLPERFRVRHGARALRAGARVQDSAASHAHTH